MIFESWLHTVITPVITSIFPQPLPILLFFSFLFTFTLLSHPLPPASHLLVLLFSLFYPPLPVLALFLLTFVLCYPRKDCLLIALGVVRQTRHDCCNQCKNTHKHQLIHVHT